MSKINGMMASWYIPRDLYEPDRDVPIVLSIGKGHDRMRWIGTYRRGRTRRLLMNLMKAAAKRYLTEKSRI